MNTLYKHLLALLLAGGACAASGAWVPGAHAATSEFATDADVWLEEEPVFLPVDEAFVMTATSGSDGALLVRWEMPDALPDAGLLPADLPIVAALREK